MGLFTKNTMNLDQMAELLGFVAMTVIESYSKSGGIWPDEKFITPTIDLWLERTGNKASIIKLTKLGVYAETLARTAVRYEPEFVTVFAEESIDERLDATHALSALGRQLLLEKGLVR